MSPKNTADEPAGTLYVIGDGEGGILDTFADEEEAVDARVRWMDGYPGAAVYIYDRRS